MMQLSTQQEEAAAAVRRWLGNDAGVFRLFGYAGTGKTTIARELSRDAGIVKFASYTGKAASVLREKGCHDATTIHKLIYLAKDKSGHRLKEMQKELAKLLVQEPAPDHGAVFGLQRAIDAERANLKRPSFSLNPDSPLADGVDLLVIDEVSMVGKKMAQDLMSFGVPILVLGDPAQLPPVGDTGFFIDEEPDFLLTEIHRQAKGNPIIALATQIRNGEGIQLVDDGGAVRVVEVGTLSIADVSAFDQVIVGTNRARHGINAQIREHRGHPKNVPVPGDKIVCGRNSHKLGLLNGSQWLVLSVRENNWSRYELDLEEIDSGRKMLDVDVFPHYFERRGEEIPPFEMKEAEHFDFSYAVTCHKAQGSEYPNVLVIDESNVFRRDGAAFQRRWLYTAITRASERLTVVLP